MRERVRHLSRGVAVYGAGDAAIQVVNLALLAVYVKGEFLLPSDYGALAILIGVEAFAKVFLRFGLDGAFMRFYFDRESGAPLARLTSTILWFLLVVDLVVIAAALAASAWVGPRVFDQPNHVAGLQLMLINVFLISTTFLPFHLMRMRDQAVAYSAFMFARSAGTTAARIVLVIGLGYGIAGWFLADLVMTMTLLPLLWRRIRPHVEATFSVDELRAVLRFGLPRLPHGVALQALDAGNRLLTSAYLPQARLGVYQNGVTLGTGIRFFLAAFETAWAPFYYGTAKQPDAKTVFRKMTTYGIAVLVLLAAVTTAVARDVILVMLEPVYLDAALVIPFIAAGICFQGVYLLTSIGINLTGRTELYPVATFSAAAAGLGSGLYLIPRFGITGAAAAFLVAYATQAAVAFALARRVYPMRYETGRLLRVLAAGVVAALVGLMVVPPMPAAAGLFARAAATTATYAALLWATGFLRGSERAFLGEVWTRLRRRSTQPAASA